MAKNPIVINLAIEDALSEAVARSILKQLGKKYWPGSVFRRHGNGYLRAKLEAFNHASKGCPFLVLTDLDRVVCAPVLIQTWCNFPLNPNLLLRVAVHEIESWLLAHRPAFAKFLSIPESVIPSKPDEIREPKEFILRAAKSSRTRQIREAIVRESSDGHLLIGPGYNSLLSQFALLHWKIAQAAPNSNSLSRAVKALKKFQPKYEDE